MTQIQEIENLSPSDLVKLVQTERQQHADDIATLSKELASRQTAINEALAFVRCDTSAATYQSLGQYRTALLKMLSGKITEV